MKKNNRTPRLGSFELLESRALLAHAGLPRGILAEMHEDSSPVDFSRGPRVEIHARNIDARDAASFSSPRGQRGDSDGRFAPGNEPQLPVVFLPSAPVLIIILPVAIPAAPQFSEPPTSSVRSTPPQTQRVSFANPPTINLPSAAASTRASNMSELSLNSLSIFSDVATKLAASSDLPSADDSEVGAQAAQDDDQPTRVEQQSQQLLRQASANESALQTSESDEEAELIELDPVELLKRTKRRGAAAKSVEAAPAREADIPLERRLPRMAEMQPAERWLTPANVEQLVTPINDDLIELLAAEQSAASPAPAVAATPFVASTTLQLDANVGFHKATDMTDAALPVEAQPADVAAAALPAREAQ